MIIQLTLVDLTSEDSGEYSCLLINIKRGEVYKGSGTVTLQVDLIILRSCAEDEYDWF